MNKDQSSAVGSQITTLVQSLTKKNYRNNVSEIEKLLRTHGYEAYKFLLRLLLKEITQATFKDVKQQLLSQVFTTLPTPNAVLSVIEGAFKGSGLKAEALIQLSKLLSLDLSHQVYIGISLAQSSDPVVQQEAINFLKSKLPEITAQGPTTLTNDVVNSFLVLVTVSSCSDKFTKDREKILKAFEPFKAQLIMGSHFASVTDSIASKRNIPSSGYSETIQEYKNDELSGNLKDMGYACTSNEDVLNKIFSQFPTLNAYDIGKALGMMAQYHTGLEENTNALKFLLSTVDKKSGQQSVPSKLNSWNLNVFVNLVKKRFPNLNWKLVIASLDNPSFRIGDQKGLSLLLTAYKIAVGGPFPAECVVGNIWKNKQGQLMMMSLLLEISTDQLDITNLRPVNMGSVTSAQRNIHPLWLTVDFVETLLNIIDDENLKQVQKLFELPMKNHPEQLIVALAEAKAVNPLIQKELFSTLLSIFVKPHKNSAAVLQQVCNINQQLLVHSLSEIHCNDNTNLRRILDIVQDLKILVPTLEVLPYRSAIELATLAAKRDNLNLEHWLRTSIEMNHGVPFARECLNYIIEKSKAAADAKADKQNLISLETFLIFLKCLQNTKLTYPQDMMEQLQQIINQLDPNVRKELKSPDFHISEEIEEKANSYFKDIFSSKLSIEDAIELLKNLKISKSQSDQELFACMIHNLFDEYRFFSQYPQTELKIVAKLFGSIIQHNIVVGKTQSFAIFNVLQSLGSPPNSKMFHFGINALTQFKQRIPEHPYLVQAIRSMPQVIQHIPDLAYCLNAPISDQENAAMQPGMVLLQPVPAYTPQSNLSISTNAPNSNPVNVVTPIQETAVTPTEEISTRPKQDNISSPSPQFGFQLDISTLTKHLQQNIVEPDEETQEKMRFIINNISVSNMGDKTAEMKKILVPEFYAYFAQHMVVNRASLEANFHSLYVKFLDGLNIKQLDLNILKQTYENIKILLSSDRIKTSDVSSERTLLKNLGSWLGLLTLEKNKPILQKDLDMKALLLDAYEGGRLIAAVPFVAKVLSHCANSKVFRYPNPWVVSLLQLLVEIHDVQDLKSNIKFEVEVLCKNLKVKLQDIEKKGLLEGRTQNKVNNPDLRHSAMTPSPLIKPPTPTITSPISHLFSAQFDVSRIPTADVTSLPELPEQIQIHEKLALFTQYPPLKKLVVMALDKAIREIIAPVVKRSVTIACKTTTELVCKDFILDRDAERMKRAAILMVQNLASKLATVTCKDPLKTSMQLHLKQLLKALAINAEENFDKKIDVVVNQVCNDNVDLGSSYVERAAKEKAVYDISDALSVEFEARRKYVQGAQTGSWTAYTVSPYVQSLPQQIHPKNGLATEHLNVYEDFMDASQSNISLSALSQAPAITTEEVKPLVTNHQEVVSQVNAIIDDITKQSRKFKKNTTLSSLPQDHEILTKQHSIHLLLKSSSSPAESSYAIGQKLVKLIFEPDCSLLLRELILKTLEVVKESSKKVVKQLTAVWNSLENDRKFNIEITTALVKAKILMPTEVDSSLSISISQGNQAAIKLALDILKNVIIEERCISGKKFSKTMELLPKYAKQSVDMETLSELIETAKTVEVPPNTQPGLGKLLHYDFDSVELESLRGKVTTQFTEWLSIYSNPKSQSSRNQFIAQLQRSGLMKTDTDFEKFCSVLIVICVERFHKLSLAQMQQIQTQQLEVLSEQELFKDIDSFSELVAFILGLSDESHKVNLLNKALTVVSKHLVREHEKNLEHFNQRIYLRFFSNILLDISASNESDTPHYAQMLLTFCNIFMMLQPQNLPTFVFAWLELVSHRAFMPKLLYIKDQKGWAPFHNLLIALLQFMEPYLRNATLNNSIRLLYKGTLKLLLVLLHDFSEFLCGFHFSLCDVIPASCIQMRNLVLSAFPRNMRLPDPFTPNLKVDLLPEINQPPEIISSHTSALEKSKLKDKIDNYLANRSPGSFLQELRQKLLLPQSEIAKSGTKYNVPLINSLVLYVGIQAIIQLQLVQVRSPIVNSPAMDIYQQLVIDLDAEGRYLFLNALANQLRYPNNHTHYYSCVLLYLFAEVRLEQDEEIVQEQITRVLLERLIVNQPHPWGLFITFIELVKNPRYNFWEKKFISCAPQIQELFENVGQKCLTHISKNPTTQ